jgi:dephospho-CoA kinase
MRIIGLTGGIGAGKSTVSSYLTTKGYEIIDADKIAREIVTPGSAILERLVGAFGVEILQQDGSLNRKKLAEIIFSDNEKKKLLDSIMQLKIREAILDRLGTAQRSQNEARGTLNVPAFKQGVVFLDAPLLYETGLDAYTDLVWLVDADEDIRIKRIMERDHITESDVRRRLMSQMTREEKLAKAKIVLDNSGGMENLYNQVDDLLLQLKTQESGEK